MAYYFSCSVDILYVSSKWLIANICYSHVMNSAKGHFKPSQTSRVHAKKYWPIFSYKFYLWNCDKLIMMDIVDAQTI